MWRLLLGLLRTTRETPNELPPAINNDHRYAAALELERRLYDAAVAAVDQTFAKEGLVAAFLASGTIVAFAASLQAFAGLLPHVGKRATHLVTGARCVSLLLLIFSLFLIARVLKGKEV